MAGDPPPLRPVFLFLFFTVLHVVEYPVPHDEETGDYHVGQETGAEEGPDKDNLVVHAGHL